MNVLFSIRIGLVSVLLGAMGCAPAVVTSLPPTVRRIAVLPPTIGLARPILAPPATESDLLASTVEINGRSARPTGSCPARGEAFRRR